MIILKLKKILNCTLAWALALTAAFTFSVCSFAEGEAGLESDLVSEEDEEMSDEELMEDEDVVEESPEEAEDEEMSDDELLEDENDASIVEDETAATEPPVIETQAPETEAVETTLNTAGAVYDPVQSFSMFVPETLNVRGGPGTNYDILGMVYPSTTVKIIGKSGEWYAFDYYGATGYLMASLLTEVPETTTSTAAPETEPPETEPLPEETSVSTEEQEDTVIDTEPAETTTKPVPVETEASEEEKEPAAPIDNDKNNEDGIPPVLLALFCAIATFIIIGVIPVLIHKAHHKKLYTY